MTRKGILRCQGPFAHPILAGTFGAVWLPLFVGLWWQREVSRVVPVVGVASCTVIMLYSGSSGPVTTYLASVVALSMLRLQGRMRTIRWLIVIGLLGLQLLMSRPVWFLFARMNVMDGSTGWHRANLIDQTIRHISDWWLFGTKDVGSWGVWAADITNQYILEAVNGGILSAGLFIVVIIIAYSYVGYCLRRDRHSSDRRFMWALGCALFAHTITFLSVSYFDQNVVNFYLLLAFIAALRATSAFPVSLPMIGERSTVQIHQHSQSVHHLAG